MNQVITAILDQESFGILFDGGHILQADVTQEKKVTKFQVEDGATRSDHVYYEPVTINIPFVVTDDQVKATYLAIQQAYKDNKLLIVQTLTDSHQNMLIESMPYSHTVDNSNGIAINIRLTEWRTVTPVYGDMPVGTTKNPAQSSTVKRGQQQTADADGAGGQEAKRKGSVLAGVFS